MLSNYNVYLKNENSIKIYNTLWKKEVNIPYSVFQNIEKSKGLSNRFKQLGFMISSENEEIRIAKSMYNSIIYQSSRLELTIMMTMNCNFKCTYCFEGHENRENIFIDIHDLISWLQKIIQKYCFSELAICFHGGEPLLFAEEIKSIMIKVTQLFPMLQFDFSCVTNGYFLSKQLANEFKQLGMKRVQITFNGAKEEHDKIRVLRSGQGTFNKIMENLKESECDFYILNLLYNDKNIDSIKSLILYLKENDLNSKIKFLTINQIEETVIGDSELYNKKSASIKIELMKFALGQGFRVPYDLNFKACTIQQKNSFVISPIGNIYKCISLIGEEKTFIGNLKDSPDDLYKNQAKFSLEDNKCIICKYYPLCNTMCFFQEKLKNNFCKKSYFEELIPNYLELYNHYKGLFYEEKK